MKRTGHWVKGAVVSVLAYANAPSSFTVHTPPPFFTHLPAFCSGTVLVSALAWSSLPHCFSFTGLQLSAKHSHRPTESHMWGLLFHLSFSLSTDTSVKLGVNSIRGCEWSRRKKIHQLAHFSEVSIAFSALERCQLQPTVLRHMQKSKCYHGYLRVWQEKINTISTHWEK